MFKLVKYFTLLVSACAFSAEALDLPPPVKIGYIEFPPLYDTVNNKAEGILSNITLKVFSDLELDYRELALPTKRVFSSLKNGKVHLWCGIQIESLKKDVWIGRQALHYLSLNIYSTVNDIEINNKKDLRGKKVILLMGYDYGGWGEFIRDGSNQVLFVEVKQHREALKLLQSGRFQYLLNYQAPMQAELEKRPIKSLRKKNISRLPIVFNVSKALPDGAGLLKQLETSLAELIKQNKVTVK